MAIVVAVIVVIYQQFRGTFASTTPLTLITARAGLSMEVGSKVTYNGVQAGRVSEVEAVDIGGQHKVRVTAQINSKYLRLMPANMRVDIVSPTLFGNKYVSFSSPKTPSAQRIDASRAIDVSTVTTEFDTIFDTVIELAQQVDPVKLNQTLSATAQALDGLGGRFGQSIVNGNEILADLNPQMPQIRGDAQQLANLADIYTNASPELFDGLQNAVTTARTLTEQERDLDQALMASVGLSNNGADTFERLGPYLWRGLDDSIPTTQLFDTYSPALFCTIRNFHDVQPKVAASTGGNGYSVQALDSIEGAGNPYTYPDNLPRVNAKGGPEGRPGCWQPITRDLWPQPYLVMDTGASIAPYNHFGLGQPLLTDYVWGRQVGEYTINP